MAGEGWTLAVQLQQSGEGRDAILKKKQSWLSIFFVRYPILRMKATYKFTLLIILLCFLDDDKFTNCQKEQEEEC